MKLNFYKKKESHELRGGFSLVEIMVSVSLFAIIMVISSASVLNVFDANRKSQSLRAVMDNLNLTLEGFTRAIRFGTTYHCDVTVGVLSSPRDCGGAGATSLSIYDTNGVQTTYKLSGGRIARSINGGTEYDLTSSDVTITNLAFRVYGSPLYSNGADLFQPQVIIVVQGFAGTKPTTRSTFSIETTVSQRIFDFQ